MAVKKPNQAAVLNTIQAAAADIVFANGKFNINDGTNDLTVPIKLMSGLSYSNVAYSAGVASTKTYNLNAVTLAANSQYRLAVVIEGRIDFASGGGKESNDLIPIREYVVWSGTTAPTASQLRDLFIARINEDAQAGVTASSGGAGIVKLVLDSVDYGDFTVEAPSGTVETVTVAYVAPSGTPAIVEKLVDPTLVSQTAHYTTYTIVYNAESRNGLVSGGKVLFENTLMIFADALAANYAAFNTEMNAVMAGTHTPVADYLGV